MVIWTDNAINNITDFIDEARQIIYKKHRVIYHIKGNDTVVLAILHTRLDINKALKRLKRDLR